MAIEIQMLVYAVALLTITILIQATAGVMHMGAPWGFGNREDVPGPTGFVGRSRRCVTNSIEAMAMFAPLALATVVAQQTDHWSALGAQLFFYGRVAYVAAYMIGIPYLRTIVWAIGMVGIVLVFYSLFA